MAQLTFTLPLKQKHRLRRWGIINQTRSLKTNITNLAGAALGLALLLAITATLLTNQHPEPALFYNQSGNSKASVKSLLGAPNAALKTIIIDNYYPYTYLNQQGQPAGFTVDLMKSVAQVMDFEVEIKVDTWQHAVDALLNGEIDFLPMMAYSTERDLIFDFSAPHTIAYDAFFTRKGAPTIRSIADLHGKTIIVMEGDQAHNYLLTLDFISPQQLILVSSLPDALRLLASGKGDTALMPKLVGMLDIKNLKLTNLEPAPIVVEAYNRPFSFAVRHGNQGLLERLSQGLDIIKSTGQYQTIYNQWFGSVEPAGVPARTILAFIGWLGLVVVITGALLLVWLFTLRKQVAQRTQHLEAEIQERKQAEQALRENELRWQNVFNDAPIGMFQSTPEGKFINVNPALIYLLGYDSPSELIELVNRSSIAAVLYENPERHPQLLKQIDQDRKSWKTFENRYRCKDGNLIDATLTISQRYDPVAQRTFLYGFIQDITERKRADAEREALLEIMQGFASTKDLQQILALIHHAIAKVIDAFNFFAVFYNKDTGLFEEVYAVDQYDPPAPPSRLEKSITAYVYRTRKPLLLSQSLFLELVAQGEVELVGTNMASWLGAPLNTPDGAIGVIAVQNYDKPGCYTEQDKDFLAFISSQVAIAFERKQDEQALRDSEANLKKAQHYARMGSWTWNIKTNHLDWSDETFRLFGLDIGKFDGTNATVISQAIHPDDRSKVEQANLAVAQGHPPVPLEYRVVWPDGSVHVVLADIGELVRNEAGAATYMSGTIQDITERKQAEQALRDSEANLKKAQHYARMGSWTWNIKINQLDWSDEMFRLFGLERETFTGSLPDVIAHAIHPEDRLKVEQSNLAVSQDNRPVPLEYRVVWPDGTVHVVWAEAGEIVLDENGAASLLSGTVQDITERKQAEQALQDSNDKFTRIFHQSQVALSLSRLEDGRYIEVNPKFLQLTERTAEEVIGHTALDIGLWADADQRDKVIKAINTQGVLHNHELNIRTKSGKILTLEWDVDRVMIKDVPCFLISASDITARKRAEKEIQTSQIELQRLLSETERSRRALLNVVEDQKEAEEQIRKLNAELEQRVKDRTAQLETVNHELEAFAYSVSHDLRAPLRALDGFSGALIADYPDKLDEQGQHYLSRIQEAARRMAQLIDDLLNLSRITRREMNLTLVDLSSAAQRIAAELQAQTPERQVTFDILPDLVARADPNLINIALENLLRNAFKFTGKCQNAHIKLGVLEQSGERVFFVRDNGAGFDMAYVHKLFTPFQRLHGVNDYPGTGIGLTIVQRIITRHGGRIWTEAAVDQGATFYFTLGDG